MSDPTLTNESPSTPDTGHHHSEDEHLTWWIARPENSQTVWRALLVVCGLLLAFDYLYHSMIAGKHGYFAFEKMPFFHAGYGLIAFIFVVLSGKQMRNYIMRSEDYYDAPYEPQEDHHHDDHLESSGHDHLDTEADHADGGHQ